MSAVDNDTVSRVRLRFGSKSRVLGFAALAVVVALVAGAATSRAAAPNNSAVPFISGSFQDGQTVTASNGWWTGATSYAYQWQDCRSYASTVLGDQPLGYWRLDDASGQTVAADTSSNHLDGTYSHVTLGATGVLAGDPDAAATMSPNSSPSISVPSSSFPTGRNPASIEVWIKLAATGTARIIGGYGSTTSYHSFVLGVSSTNHAQIQIGGGTTYVGNTTLTAGTWYQVVAVDDGTYLDLYVDGVLDHPAFTPTGSFSKDDSFATFGTFQGLSGGYFSGTLDEAAIYNSALTAAQVQTHYATGTDIYGGPACSNVASAGTDQLYQLASGDVGSRLRVQVTATNSDGSTTANSAATLVTDSGPTDTDPPTLTGQPTVGATLTGSTGTWDGSDPTFGLQWQNCGYANQVLQDSPLGYWRLGDASGTTAVDASGGGHNGTYGGGPTLGAPGALSGDGDTAASFDGAKDYVNLLGSYPTGRNPVTLEAWVKPTAESATQFVLGYGGGTTNGDTFALAIGGSTVHAEILDRGGSWVGTTALTVGGWNQLAAVDTGTSVLLYVNGELDSTFSPLANFQKGNGFALIGGNATALSGTGYFFKGSIDEAAIYGSALSASQIASDYDAATNAESSAGCNAIAGATGSTYTVQSSDVAHKLRLAVTASKADGSSSTAYTPMVFVGSAVPQNTLRPSISGTLTAGSTVTASSGQWSGSTPMSYAYQWEDCTYRSTVLADQPLAYWRLGELDGTVAQDATINNRDGTYSSSGVTLGVPGALSGDGDTAMYTDGTGTVYDTDSAFHQAQFSIELWMKPGRATMDNAIFATKVDSSGANVFTLATGAASGSTLNKLVFRVWNTAGGSVSLTSNATVDDTTRWYHIVAVQNGTELLLYINGQLDGSIAFTGTVANNSGPVTLGSDPYGTDKFVGSLDEFAYYPSALSAAQVSTHYADSTCAPISGATSASYTIQSSDAGKDLAVAVTATNSSGTTTADAQAQPVAATGAPTVTHLPTISGAATVGTTLNVTQGTWSSSNQPLTLTDQWQDCTYTNTVLADHPNAYWPLDEQSGTTASDASGNGNSGTYTNNPQLGVPGALGDNEGTAVDLSNGSKVVIPVSSTIKLADPNEFTLEAWVKTTSGGVIFTRDTGDYQLAIETDASDNKLHLFLYDLGSATPILAESASAFPTDGQYHYVVAEMTDGGIYLYLDAQPLTLENENYQTLTDSGSDLVIGGFAGQIDEAAYYSTSLPTARILAHYQAASQPCTDIAGATGTSYTLASSDLNDVVRDVETATDSATPPDSATAETSVTPVVANASVTTGNDGPQPEDGATIPTKTPALAIPKPSGNDTYDFQFELANDEHFTSGVQTSSWALTDPYSVPTSWGLTSNHLYYWNARTKDLTSGVISAWSSPVSFTVQTQLLGTRDDWPMWSHGPTTVNLTNGNLVVSAPVPSFSAPGGAALSATLIYNSQSTSNGPFGKGWLLTGTGAGESPPNRLIDYSQVPSVDMPTVEIDWPDAGADFYNQSGQSNLYSPPPGEDSMLTKNGDGTWSYYSPDGALYTFGATDSSGTAYLEKAEYFSASLGKSQLVYSYVTNASGVTLLSAITDMSGRTLSFVWASVSPSQCTGTDVVLCVTGPDGITWRYITNGSSLYRVTYPLATAPGGIRDAAGFGYDGNGHLTDIYNANDLDPADASPGYDSTHEAKIVYDSSTRVQMITDGPISDQTPSSSSWTFAYTTPTTTPSNITADPTQEAHVGLPAGTARLAAGYTTVENPNGGITKTYFDDMNHPLETIDPLGRKTQTGYNDKNELIWTEDADGNPTDNVYDSVDNVLTSSQGPDPDGSGPLTRPLTQYRYDEQTPGDATTSGTPLNGLTASFFTNQYLAGRAAIQRTDATVNFNWGSGGPSGLGQTDNFSARWSGDLTIPAGQGGDYRFYTVSDAGARLVIDKTSLINDWNAHSAKTDTSPLLHLDGASKHTINLEYYETTGSAEMQLYWQCLDCPTPIAKQILPSSSLLPAYLNQTSVVSPAGRISFSHYAAPWRNLPDYSAAILDPSDPLSTTLDPVTSFTYNAYGQATEKVMPKGNAARTIDANGNLNGSPDLRFATTYIYYTPGATAAPPQPCSGSSADQAGQLETEAQHGLAAITYVYDSGGRTIAKTNGAGTTCFSYSTDGRLLSEDAHGDAQPTTFTYDPAGEQLTESDASGTLSTQYDEAGRVEKTTDTWGAVATFTYDADGNILSRKATPPGTSGYTTSYSYDTDDELTQEQGSATTTPWLFCYDSRGNLEGTQYPNGTYSWVDTNPAGWTQDLYNQSGTIVTAPGVCPTAATAGSSPIADFAYTYNEDGQKTQEQRTAGSTTDTTSYVYDGMGRLSQAMLPDGTIQQYSFDLDSNRTSLAKNGTTTASYTYDPTSTPGVDQLTSVTTTGTTNYQYNSDGEVTSYGTNTLTWDGWQRLTGGTFNSTAVSYSYDPSGTLRERTSGSQVTGYLLGDLFETDGTTTITTSYQDGPAGDLAQYTGTPSSPTTVSYLYYNGHGDLAAEADASGNLTGTPQTYDPFGVPLATQPTNTTEHLFTGRWNKQYDTTSSLVLMGARPYDPSLGRFLAVDPVDGGSLNNYDYAGQDPVNKLDLTGRYCTPDEFQNFLSPFGSTNPDCGHLYSDYEYCVKKNADARITDNTRDEGCYVYAAAKYRKKYGHSPIPPSQKGSFCTTGKEIFWGGVSLVTGAIALFPTPATPALGYTSVATGSYAYGCAVHDYVH